MESGENPHAEKLAELERQHERIAHATLPGGKLFVFRAPTLDEWEDFQEGLRNGKRRGAMLRQLAQQTLVHPALEELQAAFQKYPVFSSSIGDSVAELGGATIEVTVKKG